MPVRNPLFRCSWLLAIVVAGPWLRISTASEFRGIWVDGFGAGFFNAEQVNKLVADCRKYNFNAVLVEMRRRGDAFYDSRVDPRTTAIPTNFDALAEIIRRCHTGTPRIEVHCWVVSHFIWAWKRPPDQSDHIFNRHPEFLTRDSIGQKFVENGYYLDPGNPDANLTVYNMAKDIVTRYDIDGLHWDYCRYPCRDSGYNETALRRFNEEFGLTGQPAPNDPKFSEWRRRQVTDFLRWVDADLWEIKPSLVISASVFSNLVDARAYRFGNWPDWTKSGVVDAAIPMDFSADSRSIFCPRADEALKCLGCRQVYVGQGAYLNDKENTLKQLGYIRQKGFAGTAFYSYRNPDRDQKEDPDNIFALVRDRLQPVWTETPPLPWKQTKAILKGTVTGKSGSGPVYNALVTLEAESAKTTQLTEPHGTFSFFDLLPGSYRVHAEAGGRRTQEMTVEAKAGHITNLALSLEP